MSIIKTVSLVVFSSKYNEVDLSIYCIPFVIAKRILFRIQREIQNNFWDVVVYSNLYSIVYMNRKDTNFFISASQSKKADSRQHRLAKKRYVQRCIQVISTYTYTSQTCRKFRPLNSEKGQSDTISYVRTVHCSNHSRLKPSCSKSIGFEQFFLY